MSARFPYSHASIPRLNCEVVIYQIVGRIPCPGWWLLPCPGIHFFSLSDWPHAVISLTKPECISQDQSVVTRLTDSHVTGKSKVQLHILWLWWVISSCVSVSSWKLSCHVFSGGTCSDTDSDTDSDKVHSVRQSVDRLLVQIFLVPLRFFVYSFVWMSTWQ